MLVTFHVLMVLRVMDLSSDPIWRNVVASVLLKGWEADKLYLASSPMVSRTKLCPEQMLLTSFYQKDSPPIPSQSPDFSHEQQAASVPTEPWYHVSARGTAMSKSGSVP